MKWRDLLNPLAVEKLRVQDQPDPGGAGGGSDVELAGTTEAMGREFAADVPPYVPPLPVPLAHPVDRPEGQRGESSEVWLVNPPTTLPGLGVLVAGGAAEKGSQFPINSLRIDNLTSQWIYFPENGAWVPPFWYGRVLRFNGSRVQRVRFETPTGLVALAAATTEVARVVFSEDYWDEQSGASVAGNLGAATGGAPNTGVVIYDDLSGLPAEVQTAADALANQAGLVTDSFGFGYNGASWDRVRLPNIFKQINNVVLGAGSTATVWTPAAGKKPRLMGWVVDGVSGLVDAAITFFETSTTGTFMGDAGYIAGLTSPSPFTYGLSGPIVSAASAVIVAFSSTAVTFRGTLFGTEE